MWVPGSVYDLTADQQATAIEMLLNHGDLVVQDAETAKSALEAFRSRPAPGFSGCLMLEMARRAGHLPLGTYDRTLGKMADTQRL